MVRYVNEPTPGSLADQQEDADPEQVARAILLRRLTASPRSRSELREDLRKRGVPDDVAERVLDRFVDVGLIDDAEFARLWAESRQRTKGAARSVLRQELRAKGIDDELVAQALEPIDAEMERQRARKLAEVRLRSLSRFDNATKQRRLVSMLVRRGYPQGLALGVVHDLVAAEVEEVEPLG